MSKDRLTKEEAFELISSVVDNEAEEHIRTAFFEYIEEDPAIRDEFVSMKRIKMLVSTRCPCHKAPDRLKVRVQEFVLAERNKSDALHNLTSGKDSDPAIDIPSHISPPQDSDNKKSQGKEEYSYPVRWLYAAAASILIIAAIWGLVYQDDSPENVYSMEEYVYQHFQKNNGKLVPPNISTASLADAEISLSSNYNMPITVPPLKKAEFKGVVLSEFVPDFKAPLLEYYLPDEDQYIYIFAFKMEQLDKFGKLTRDQKAVKKCIQPSDFHIEEVNGKHVVSWRWNNTWYAAISNHNGKTLASLIQPLKYDLDSSN